MSGPAALSRYRPILYLFTGVAAAYAIVYIHSSFRSPAGEPSQTLRRRGAVRRQRHDVRIVDTPSYHAIAHLEQLMSEGAVYGTFRIETEDGRRVESGLLPSLLATRDQLMEEVGVPPSHAERIREMMEDTFLESFLALDLPPSHILPEGSAERNYLTEQLQRRGISGAGIERALARFNRDPNFGEELRRRRQNGERLTLSTSTIPDAPLPTGPVQDGGETVVDDQSVFSWREGPNEISPTREGQNLLNLLYHIAEDQARRDGYIHRGVTCNSCGAMPIQGIRYRCANCIDYDLCETCEAMQVHIKTHLFYKVRIPAPFLGNPRQSQPVWYPGKPAMLARSVPRSLAKRLMKETHFENTELDALWDQFRCLANYEWPEDPNKLGMAIDRKTFDRCFVPNTTIRPPPPSLIYDRMFAFYDTNGDNLIGFEEFLKGLASFNNKSSDERMRRIFRGYDIDGDGYVERKDFLRMFRAYYALSRELTRDMVAGMEDDFLEGGARDVLLGSQPISSAFPGTIPEGEVSRIGEGKQVNREGDMEIVDHEGILRQDGADTGDRYTIIGDAAVRENYVRTRPVFPATDRLPTGTGIGDLTSVAPGAPRHEGNEDDDEASESESDDSSSSVASASWPPAEQVHEEDIVSALGAYVPLQEVTDSVDRARISTAVYHRMLRDDQTRRDEVRRYGIDERWRRRGFYLDEEDGATIPEGYQTDTAIDDLSDEGEDSEEKHVESHPPSPRSRSSSKVRFQDDLTDDYDVRSNPSTSSRSIPVGERWGGFEIPEVERDVGKEILYQATQQGLNELLDILFKPKEDLLMEARRTRADRKKWAREIEMIEQMDPEKRNQSDGGLRPGPTEDIFASETFTMADKPLEELLQRAGYSVRTPPVETNHMPILEPPATDTDLQADGGIELDETVIDAGSDKQDLEAHAEAVDPDVDTVMLPPPAHNSHHEFEGNMAEEVLSAFDPTMPQFRPNEEDAYQPTGRPIQSDESATAGLEELADVRQLPLPSHLHLQLNGTTSFPAPEPLGPYSPEAEATAPKPPTSPVQSLPPASAVLSSLHQSHEPPPLRQPSTRTLKWWAFLNQVERKAKERGGTGAKLNFEEFSRRMNTDRDRKLGFVGSWIEMASF